MESSNQNSTPANHPGFAGVTPETIFKNFKPNMTPQELVAANLGNAAPPPVTPNPQEVSDKIAQERKLESVEDIKYDLEPKEKESAPAGETKTVAASEDVRGDDTNTDVKHDTKEDSFKKLRTKVSETTKALEEKDRLLKDYETKVKKYETGEELPEVLRAKENRIAELERYEKLHALKMSPAYKETFIKPISSIKDKLNTIAKDYNLPQAVMEEALGFTNRKELNNFLLDHFDEVGAKEVKDLVASAQELTNRAKEAEIEPAKVMAEIEKDYEAAQEEAMAKARSQMVGTSKDAWVDSLLRIKAEGKIHELIAKDNDPEHNEKYVTPVLQAAGTEYAKLIKALANSGLKELPKDLAFALARLTHLAHASAVSIATRVAAEQELDNISQNIKRTTSYERPQIGGSFGGNGGEAANQPRPITSIDDITKQAMAQANKIVSGRR